MTGSCWNMNLQYPIQRYERPVDWFARFVGQSARPVGQSEKLADQWFASIVNWLLPDSEAYCFLWFPNRRHQRVTVRTGGLLRLSWADIRSPQLFALFHYFLWSYANPPMSLFWKVLPNGQFHSADPLLCQKAKINQNSEWRVKSQEFFEYEG